MSDKMPKVRRTFYTIVVKRILDIFLSGLALIVLSPLLLLICIFELLFHGRPILYSQERPGLNEKMFRLYKFRSMTNERDANGELLPGNKRITVFGRFLRRFSLDELPELFCIFIGQMSVIGPRPLLPEYLPYYTKRHRMRHSVKPGLTCIPLKPTKTLTWNTQFENDIWYVENVSFGTDIKMVIAVIREVMQGREFRVEDKRQRLAANYWKNDENIE